MKKLLLTLTLLISVLSFAQPQTLNGISFDAPNGYIKTDNLLWKKNNNVLKVMALEKIPPSSLQPIVEQDTRYSKHYYTYDFKYNGKTYKIGIHNSNNGLVQAQLAVNKGDWCYLIMTVLEPESFTASNSDKVESVLVEVYSMMGYIVPRINP